MFRLCARRLPLVALAAVLGAGCGGIQGGIQTLYAVSPERATVAPAGTVALTARVTEGGYSDLTFTVREGARGGTVVKDADATSPDATYTAPAAPGAYHVDVAFLNGTSVSATRTATIVVRAAG